MEMHGEESEFTFIQREKLAAPWCECDLNLISFAFGEAQAIIVYLSPSSGLARGGAVSGPTIGR
jgi:hypothetical protein